MTRAIDISSSINEVIFGRDPGMDTNCVCPQCGNETNYEAPVACSSRSCSVCGASSLTNPDYDPNHPDNEYQDPDYEDNLDDYDFPYQVGNDQLIQDDDFLPTEGRPTGEYLNYYESHDQNNNESETIGLNNIGWGLGTGLDRSDTPFNRFASFGPSTRKMSFTGPRATALKLAVKSATHESPPVGTPGTAPIGYTDTDANDELEPPRCVCDSCGYSISNTTGQDCSVIPCPQCGAL
jgi:hypothetical protein